MVFGIRAENTDIHAGRIDADKYRSVAEQLCRRFPTLRTVAVTLRESLSASDNHWSAVAWDGHAFIQSRRYTMHIVDRVGGGDAFAAGLIHELSQKRPLERALEFATAASCLKHSIPGDFNLVSAAEVEDLMGGGGNGRVVR